MEWVISVGPLGKDSFSPSFISIKSILQHWPSQKIFRQAIQGGKRFFFADSLEHNGKDLFCRDKGTYTEMNFRHICDIWLSPFELSLATICLVVDLASRFASETVQ